ncbi:MAG: prepilin-type N-terminal cleavage/methylation domain-containing protein [Candidatus Omnitrophica bacterium]|nr:prepilin-type N-terminal cleavage/methylation domain-containing protein [Candidatus Omnitrophota bacterium]
MRTSKFMRRENIRGFTLVEVMISSAILAIILSMAYGIYLGGLDIWDVAGYKADLQGEARNALSAMANELMRATREPSSSYRAVIPSPYPSTPSTANNSVRFYLPVENLATGNPQWDPSNPIDYRLDNQTVVGKTVLMRSGDGLQKILAKDASGVQFIFDPNLSIYEIRIILTLSKTTPRGRPVSITSTSIVRLRN